MTKDKIAFQGEEGAYSHLACEQIFPGSSIKPCPTFEETFKTAYEDDTFKHKNPQVSKDIVGFELHINWNYPVCLVEGAVDAIAIKRNAIPLFGKTIPDQLKHRIIENNVKTIYICLDKDARV